MKFNTNRDLNVLIFSDQRSLESRLQCSYIDTEDLKDVQIRNCIGLIPRCLRFLAFKHHCKQVEPVRRAVTAGRKPNRKMAFTNFCYRRLDISNISLDVLMPG